MLLSLFFRTYLHYFFIFISTQLLFVSRYTRKTAKTDRQIMKLLLV